MHICMCVHICMNTDMHQSIHVHMDVWRHTYINLYGCTKTGMHIWMDGYGKYVYVNTYICIHTCIQNVIPGNMYLNQRIHKWSQV